MAPATPSSLKSRLRDKVPEMILEAVSVVLAVLLALAVDSWRDDRRNAREAERARQGVLEEIAANHAELASTTEENRAMLGDVRRGVEALSTEAEEDDQKIQVEYSVALLSSAAWQTAQVTLSVHHLEFAWLTRISKLYELQALYNRRQDELVTFMAAASSDFELTSLSKRLETVMKLHDALLRDYEEVHPDLEAPA